MLSRLAVLGDRVLVQRVAATNGQTASGIHLPESAIQMVNEATVLAVGPKTKYQVAVGDVVVVPEFGGMKMKFDNKTEAIVFREEDLLGKLA